MRTVIGSEAVTMSMVKEMALVALVLQHPNRLLKGQYKGYVHKCIFINM